VIDHEQPGLGTFAQRYYIDESLSTSNNAPVFFYICGEAECRKSTLYGSIRKHAEKYHAKLIALEHRYYGKSLPAKQLTADNLKYLTIENALKDLAGFQQFISKERHWTGKWIAFGGSYPGSLSAYYRLKYPNLVAGSLASSAPVQAKEDFQEYDEHVTNIAGETCANKMREAYKEVELALNDEKRLAEIKTMFNAEDISDKTDFLSMLAEIGAGAVQYGMRDRACNILNDSRTPLDGYAFMARYISDYLGIKPSDLVFQGAMKENADTYDDIGMRQWFYQTCTEYGYWQTANSDPAKSTRSALINLDYYRQGCYRLFGKDLRANIDHTNQLYYSPLLNESVRNILFTNGSSDPWSRLSMTKENGNDTNKNLNYYTIQGAAHCDDLRPDTSKDSDSLKQARLQMDELINKWIR
jgi:pimeloyl-ACP methyl ester carboxylesterase